MVELAKSCRACGADKALAEFHVHKRGKYGRDTICKPCNKTKTYAWRAANPGSHARVQCTYRKRHPDRVKVSLAAWHAKHPEYERERSARRWATDPRYRERIRAWCKAHPELMRAYDRNNKAMRRSAGGRGLTAAQIFDLLSRPCAYCGGKATEIDHVIPVSRGGQHDIDNVAPACRSCNARKYNRLPEEWNHAAH